jgi:hypothetical protein
MAFKLHRKKGDHQPAGDHQSRIFEVKAMGSEKSILHAAVCCIRPLPEILSQGKKEGRTR